MLTLLLRRLFIFFEYKNHVFLRIGNKKYKDMHYFVSQMHYIFYFLRRCFASFITAKTFTGFVVLSEAATAYPSRAPEFTFGFFGETRVAYRFSLFLCVLSYYVSLRSEYSVVMSVAISP